MPYYETSKIETQDGMSTLRSIFPKGEADDYQFALFSTSGVHGHYCSIETAEEQEDVDTVTFLIIQHRVVSTMYGNCRPESGEDFEFLKKLRDSSKEAVQAIG